MSIYASIQSRRNSTWITSDIVLWYLNRYLKYLPNSERKKSSTRGAIQNRIRPGGWYRYYKVSIIAYAKMLYLINKRNIVSNKKHRPVTLHVSLNTAVTQFFIDITKFKICKCKCKYVPVWYVVEINCQMSWYRLIYQSFANFYIYNIFIFTCTWHIAFYLN